MSDRSDETGPVPETPGGDNHAAESETAPESTRDEPTSHGNAEDPGVSDIAQTPPAHATEDPRPDDTIALPADATTVRPTDESTAAAADRTTVPPPHDTTAPATGQSADHAATGPDLRDAAIAANRSGRSGDPLQHTAAFDRPLGDPFLTATGLTAHGRQGPIFTDITLTAGLGQLVAICGDGGEGRSSLLLALTGRFAIRSGALEVDGHTRPGQIRRRFTIAQAGPPIRFDPYATVRACIKETTTVSKGTATRANINAWLDRLAVSIDTGDTFGFLPRIDQIRFAIACAAASRTPAIAVDDTDTGLDTCGSERVFDALRTVADAGQLVLAACTRSDPPADTVVDLRAQPAPTALQESDRNGGHR